MATITTEDKILLIYNAFENLKSIWYIAPSSIIELKKTIDFIIELEDEEKIDFLIESLDEYQELATKEIEEATSLIEKAEKKGEDEYLRFVDQTEADELISNTLI